MAEKIIILLVHGIGSSSDDRGLIVCMAAVYVLLLVLSEKPLDEAQPQHWSLCQACL